MGNIIDIQYVWVPGSNNITSYPFSTYFQYCLQDCPPAITPGPISTPTLQRHFLAV
ncbi:MAG: hypothetical protein J0H07_15510 [Sphingobacteriales bacterium]|nr:hypothetical protein [Sphingobacteriales bacterium]